VREFAQNLVNPAKDPFFHGDRGVSYIEKNGRRLYTQAIYIYARARAMHAVAACRVIFPEIRVPEQNWREKLQSLPNAAKERNLVKRGRD